MVRSPKKRLAPPGLRRPGKPDRRLVLNAQKLAHGDEANILLLVSVLDVTDARIAEKLKDDLLRDKAVLLQELQHRVANSLQIIASVLMQSARKVQSEEARSHLHDAHQRVMSVASLQHQLAASAVGEVALRPYFTSLCESIGASMIRDHTKLSLDINIDGSVTSADESVSLGLIVTELVINALKHAFPNDRSGTIKVGYQSQGPNWTLSARAPGSRQRTQHNKLRQDRRFFRHHHLKAKSREDSPRYEADSGNHRDQSQEEHDHAEGTLAQISEKPCRRDIGPPARRQGPPETTAMWECARRNASRTRIQLKAEPARDTMRRITVRFQWLPRHADFVYKHLSITCPRPPMRYRTI